MVNHLKNRLDKDSKRPIIIWGTGAAGQISYRVLCKLNLATAAAGDNNSKRIGERWNCLPVLSAQEIKNQYPNALIVVSVFAEHNSRKIVLQLKQLSAQFSFCKFEEIEFLYETEYLKRGIKNKEKFYQIVNNIHQDGKYIWKRKIDKRVISEYRYVIRDRNVKDLKEILSKVYGIKNLLLISSSKKNEEIVALVKELSEYENIGHIILVIERSCAFHMECLSSLAGNVFYLMCDETMEESTKSYLEKEGFVVHTRRILEEIFLKRLTCPEVRLTEKLIVQSIWKYVNENGTNLELQKYQDTKPVHIVQLFNGLTNQALMYLFGRYLEEESGGIVIFDDTILSLDIYDEQENKRRMQKWNHFETLERAQELVAETKNRSSFYKFKRAEVAEVFDISVRLLSDYFEKDVWEKYLEKVKKEHSYKYAQSFPLGQVLIDNEIDITIIRDNIMPDDFFAVDKCYCLDAYVLDKPCVQNSITDFLFHSEKNLYGIGIWATGRVEDCYLSNRPWVRKQLPFRLQLNEESKRYVEEITQADSIVIHIRRGDFAFLNMSADVKYFSGSIQAMEALQEYRDKKYFIFSDDLGWCMKNENALGINKVKNKAVFVSGNTGVNNYLDLYLMSLGKAIIPTPGSSFSYVAMLVSKSIEKCIDVPRYLYDLDHGETHIPVVIDV
ncbi:MAG: hypothetical protein HFI23_07295 [Lachnospiraceae bacterium]|nr:hypothetical protein [Lachnospiraceae bacterium]